MITAVIIDANRLFLSPEQDVAYVALTLELEGLLWSSDHVLEWGLRKKGFTHFFNPELGEEKG